MGIKSELKEICLKLATNGQSDKGFLLTSKFVPQGLVCPCHGAIYTYERFKIYTRTRCEVSVYTNTGPLVTINDRQSDKGFLLTSKFVPQGLVCPCHGAIYTYERFKIYTRTRCEVSVNNDHWSSCYDK